MTKIVLQDIASLTNETAALAALNSNSAIVETASDNSLSRDGTTPNQMLADFDMNSNDIINLPAPVNSSSPLRLAELSALQAAVGGTINIGSNADSVSYNQGGTGAATRTVGTKLREFLSVKDFGAVGDGSTDDTAAINSWLTALTTGKAGLIPAGTYKFTSALSKTDNSHFSIMGMGGQESTLLYAGANTTNDIITFGDGIAEVGGVYLSNFRIDSSTTMSGGNGLRLRNIVRSALNNVVIGGQDGNNKLFDGAFIDQADQVIWNGFDVKTLNDGVKVRGGVAGARSNLLMLQGKIVQCGRFGLVIGGGFGGFYAEACDIISNTNHNVIIDQSLVATGNREIFFGPGCFMDSSATGSGLHLNNGFVANGYLQLTGTWLAGNALQGINVTSAETAASRILITGGTLFSNGQDGLRVSSTGPLIGVAGALIRNNSGWGINNASAGTNCRVGLNFFNGNASGEVTGTSSITTDNGLTLNSGSLLATKSTTASGTQTLNSFTGTKASTTGGGGIPQLLGLTYTDNSTSVTGELSNQLVRFVYTWNGTTPSTAFDAMFDFSPVVQQNLTTLFGLNIEGPVVSVGKTLTTWNGISVAAPSGAGTVTNKVAINIAAGAGNITTADGVLSSGTAGLGYSTGAGGTVTQATNKATAVTLNKITGAITMNNASLAAGTIVSFTLNDTAIAATDLIMVMHESGGTLGSYTVNGRATGAGTAAIDIRNNTAGALGEALVLRFAVIKSVNA